MKYLMSALLLSSMFLSGCPTLNDSFDCPAPKGGTCKRMDEVYDMVNGHESLRAETRLNPLKINGGQQSSRAGVTRLWIAPYEDTDGNYHQANSVYVKVRENNASSTFSK